MISQWIWILATATTIGSLSKILRRSRSATCTTTRATSLLRIIAGIMIAVARSFVAKITRPPSSTRSRASITQQLQASLRNRFPKRRLNGRNLRISNNHHKSSHMRKQIEIDLFLRLATTTTTTAQSTFPRFKSCLVLRKQRNRRNQLPRQQRLRSQQGNH